MTYKAMDVVPVGVLMIEALDPHYNNVGVYRL